MLINLKQNLIKHKKDFFSFIILITFSIMYMIYIYNNICINTGFENDNYKFLYWGISISLLFIISIIIILIKVKTVNSYILFIVLSTILGITFLIVAPQKNGSDEMQHFFKTYEVATGQFITDLNDEGKCIQKNVPKSFIELVNSKNEDGSIKIHDLPEKYELNLNMDEVTDRYGFAGTRGYSPVVYIPQALGMFIGLKLNLKPLIIANLARIFGFVAWMIMCAYAIKIIPFKKEFLLILALLPANLTSAVTLSADTILNGITLVLIAKVLQVYHIVDKINIKDYLVLLGSSIIIGQCKMAYLPIIFICLLIPVKKYGNKKKYFIGNGIIIFLTLLGTYIWMKLVAYEYYGIGQTNEQQQWILTYPAYYIIVMFRTIIEYFNNLFCGIAAGNNLYRARVQVPEFISLGLMACLIISLWIKESKINLKIWKKILVICIMGAMSLLVLTAMYISATTIVTGQIGTKIIEGLQGRYFIPIIILSVFLVNKKRIDIDEKNLYAVNIMLQFVVILHTMQTFI